MSTASASRSRFPVRALILVAVAAVATAAVFAFRRQTAAASGLALARENLQARGEMCSSRNITGTGVLMEVFPASGDSATASGLVPVLDVNTAPAATPIAGQRVRWSGWIKAKATGSHQFRLPAGVRGRFTLSRIVLVGDGATAADSARLDLTGNRFYPFTLEIVVDAAASSAGTWLLSWVRPDRGLEPVMRGSLFPPTNLAKPLTGEEAEHDTH
jgi:hypothetical protein